MLTIEPPPLRTISGMACLQVSIWLRRFTAMVRSHTSSDRSVTAVSRVRKSESVSAALLWSTSRRPNCVMAAAIAATTSSSSDRSALNAAALPPACSMSSATRSAAASSMSTTRTDAPSLARARAVAPPMPPPPPVTMATLSLRRPMLAPGPPVARLLPCARCRGSLPDAPTAGDPSDRQSRPALANGRRAGHVRRVLGASTRPCRRVATLVAPDSSATLEGSPRHRPAAGPRAITRRRVGRCSERWCANPGTGSGPPCAGAGPGTSRWSCSSASWAAWPWRRWPGPAVPSPPSRPTWRAPTPRTWGCSPSSAPSRTRGTRRRWTRPWPGSPTSSER